MRDWKVWFFIVVMTTIVLISHECDHLEARSNGNLYAYIMGTTVQTTGEGALFYCHSEPDYVPIKHTKEMFEMLRRYVEAACS